MIKAAQYVRMSSDRQELSPGFQKDAIAAYADAHDMEVVATYEDLGKSGVSLVARSGLTRLLNDVKAHPSFSVILVYDVSRWGRFQDSDASAYYDYHCRLHGVSLVYVAESFGDDISPLAALLKGMRRVMAAEFSRDLAVKCAAAQERVLSMGFQMGPLPCLGYRRESNSSDGLRRLVLEHGQHKYTFTDRIHWVLAGDEEVALVRQIFDIYAHTGCTVFELAQRAVTDGWVCRQGRPLTKDMLTSLLRNEAVIGNFSWGGSTTRRPRIVAMDLHRQEGGVPRIVDANTWALTQAKLKEKPVGSRGCPKDELLRVLKLALQRNPSIGQKELSAYGCASVHTYRARFGSWPAALEATGIDRNHVKKGRADRVLQRRAARYRFGRALEKALERRGVRALFNGKLNVLKVGRASIRIGFLWPDVKPGGQCVWRVKGYQSIPEVRRVLFVRMDATDVALDFFLVDQSAVAAGFPRWLAREIPMDLQGFRSPTMALLLNRLASLPGATSAEGPDTFSAVALARHRERLGLTAKECGALTGAHPITVYMWEKGYVRPYNLHLRAIARFQRLGKGEATARLNALIR